MSANNLFKKAKQKVEDLISQYQKGEVSIDVLTNAIEDAEYYQRRAKLTQEERNAEDRREEELLQRTEGMLQPLPNNLELDHLVNLNTTAGAPAPEHNPNITGGARKKRRRRSKRRKSKRKNKSKRSRK